MARGMAVSFKTAGCPAQCDGPMSTPDIDAAAQFIAGHARVVDRRRFERLFAGGDARPVRDAVAAYRNPDGGFGHGLEPDGRAPGSQPPAAELALRILDETDAWDDDLAGGACRWLQGTAPAEGGAAFVDPGIEAWPHAPWWVPEEGRPASLVITGLIAGTLHARHVSHPWLDGATDVMWSRIRQLTASGALAAAPAGGYEMFGVLRFLQHVPDQARARDAFGRAGPLILERGLVALDPEAPGEVHSPLDFAPEPDSLARGLFHEATIKAHLDHLAQAQRQDGGWMVNWPTWSPAAERDWRGSVTVDALRRLRANGHL
jgi:hypothetical protein